MRHYRLRRFLICAAAVLSACGSPPQRPMPAVPVVPKPVAPQLPEAAKPAPAALPAAPTPRYLRVEWSAIEGWRDDDLLAAWPAFLGGCAALKTKPDWQAACAAAQQASVKDAAAARRFFETQFGMFLPSAQASESEGLVMEFVAASGSFVANKINRMNASEVIVRRVDGDEAPLDYGAIQSVTLRAA